MGITPEQREEAIAAVRTAIYREQARNVTVTELIVDKLIDYGIHPNAIIAAFKAETKKDVDRTNEDTK